MSFSRKSTVKAGVRFTPSRTLVIEIKFECDYDELANIFLKDFSYSLDVEQKDRALRSGFSIQRFVIKENRSGSILWSTEKLYEILDMLGSVSENGFFIEELSIRAGGREYLRSTDQEVSSDLRKEFRKIVKRAVMDKR